MNRTFWREKNELLVCQPKIDKLAEKNLIDIQIRRVDNISDLVSLSFGHRTPLPGRAVQQTCL